MVRAAAAVVVVVAGVKEGDLAVMAWRIVCRRADVDNALNAFIFILGYYKVQNNELEKCIPVIVEVIIDDVAEACK